MIYAIEGKNVYRICFVMFPWKESGIKYRMKEIKGGYENVMKNWMLFIFS